MSRFLDGMKILEKYNPISVPHSGGCGSLIYTELTVPQEDINKLMDLKWSYNYQRWKHDKKNSNQSFWCPLFTEDLLIDIKEFKQ